jgi:hypothetical protein
MFLQMSGGLGLTFNRATCRSPCQSWLAYVLATSSSEHTSSLPFRMWPSDPIMNARYSALGLPGTRASQNRFPVRSVADSERVGCGNSGDN